MNRADFKELKRMCKRSPVTAFATAGTFLILVHLCVVLWANTMTEPRTPDTPTSTTIRNHKDTMAAETHHFNEVMKARLR